MPEMLDYVDENDNVIGQATREEILTNGWACRIIQIWIINSKNKILVQWRGAHKKKPHLFDSSVGGHVDAGESYEVAAHREMQEEMGIIGSLKHVSKIYNEEVNKFGQFYVINHDGPFSHWQKEADAIEWFTLEELEQLVNRLPYMFTGGLKDSLKAYKKYLGEQ